MPAGRPATPIERKRALGTLRNDRLPNQPVLITQALEPPEPPETLSSSGQEFWRRVFQYAPWISHTSDLLIVQLAAEQIDEREQLRAQVLEQPDNIRLRSGLRELEKALVGTLARMGFTPSDRSRLGFAEVKKESKLEELRRKLEDR